MATNLLSFKKEGKYKAEFVTKDDLGLLVLNLESGGTNVLVKIKKEFLPRKCYHDQRAWKISINHGSKNIKISMNGALELTFEEWNEFKDAIDEGIRLVYP